MPRLKNKFQTPSNRRLDQILPHMSVKIIGCASGIEPEAKAQAYFPDGPNFRTYRPHTDGKYNFHRITASKTPKNTAPCALPKVSSSQFAL
jgi:hypothetical protein